jgi:hypothetical protein
MKKISIYFFALITSLGFLTSCGETDVETPAPTITVSVDAANANPAQPNDVLKFTVQAEAAEKIEKINLTQKIGTSITQVTGFPVTSGFSENNTKYLDVVSYTVPAEATSNIELTFEVTDKQGKVTAEAITITVGGEINTYTQILLGGQSNSTDPSFYAARTNTRYKLEDASNNQTAIDLIFAYGTTNENYIGAPNDADIALSHTAVANWATKNATKFKTTTLTAADFDAVTNDTQIIAQANGAAASKVNKLVAGQVFAFETVGAAPKKGLVKVVKTEGTDGSNRKITFEVKIQK